ncbi:hypothetical protein, partial [Eubacterium aggregans]|uniref:hypothetical protein n=1 Tax=Eubacterium aggregans TaxID=81409 RepID=UPI003F35AA35
NTATGNTAKVIIDKTNPKIVAIDVDINQVPVYKAGFKLSDHFKIEEKYLRSVSCTLAQRSGLGRAKAWELDKAIHDEGLMTAQIISEDMANNTSDTLKYSFYVDGTAPKPILRVGNKTLNNERVEEIGNTATLDIGLDRIEMGDEKPDRYTRLEIQDQDGKVIKNLMGNQKEMTLASYPFSSGNGKFKIVTEARDDVGNAMEATYWVQLSSEGSVGDVTTTNIISHWWFVLGEHYYSSFYPLSFWWLKKEKKKMRGRH